MEKEGDDRRYLDRDLEGTERAAAPQGSRTRAVLTLIVPVISIAVVMPLIMGPDWLTTGWALMASVAFPLVVVGMIIPDSFAGERERHTLGRLLASRLPDRAILLGKLALSVVYGWAMTLLILLVSATAVNAMHWDGQVMFYKPGIALAHLAVSQLMSFLVAGLGILISLRAATVQGAQQALFAALLIPLSLLQFVPMLLLSVVPNGRARLRAVLTAIQSPSVVATILVLWLIVDLTLLAAAIARFRQARLTLARARPVRRVYCPRDSPLAHPRDAILGCVRKLVVRATFRISPSTGCPCL